MTIGPEPRPIRTGATLHTLAVTYGMLAGYKLHARTFGGRSDGDLGMRHKNCETIHKWINLMSKMIDEYKNAGRFVTMDSAYMGDIMAQIGREVWGMNMVGTVQCNRSGAPDTKVTTTKMKAGTYESTMWQHNNKPLMFAAWCDNSVVKTLSNCHGPVVLPAGQGVNRKRKGDDGKRERESTEMACPAQMKYYCETFHLIDKGNGAEASYDLGGKSRTHNWSPKIILRLINMLMINAYRIYKLLVTTRTPDRHCLTIREAIKELTFSLMQRGAPMRRRETSHPNPTVDCSRILGWSSGMKIRSDEKKPLAVEAVEAGYGGSVLLTGGGKSTYNVLVRMQKKSPWWSHHSVGAKENARGKCCWGKCPGLKSSNAKRTRSYDTVMTCEECSAKTGSNVWLCSGVKRGDVLPCHIDYHKFNFNKVFTSTAGG